MGFPNLNRLLTSKCSPSAIYTIHLKDLSEKRVVVDISIYLYRFMKDGCFMENIYLFLSLFQYYRIVPIFVFDGKPPAEKQETIKKRSHEKKMALKEIQELTDTIQSYTDEEKGAIENRLKVLQRKAVKVSRANVEQVVELIEAFGFAYYFAPQEADPLCVHMVKTGLADMAMSDDMDIIISGCSRVIRNLNLVNHTTTMYDTRQILQELDLNIAQLREIVVLAGSDYHTESYKKISLFESFELYQKYRDNAPADMSFYEWVNAHYFSTENISEICRMFEDSTYTDELNTFLNEMVSETRKMNMADIQSIMRKHRFIFV